MKMPLTRLQYGQNLQDGIRGIWINMMMRPL